MHELAKNRADLLSYEDDSQKEIRIVSTEVKENVLHLTLQVTSSLTHAQIKNYPMFIKQGYCENADTRRLMENGVRYHLNVLDKKSASIMSFDVDSEQCGNKE